MELYQFNSRLCAVHIRKFMLNDQCDRDKISTKYKELYYATLCYNPINRDKVKKCKKAILIKL